MAWCYFMSEIPQFGTMELKEGKTPVRPYILSIIITEALCLIRNKPMYLKADQKAEVHSSYLFKH